MIAQLDAHLDLLGVDGNYGRIWSPSDTNALFATAYQGLRDTGRRPGEVVSLRTQCVERDGEDWALVYDNHKKGRLRRRLPITAATAWIIQAWQVRRAGIDLPQCAEGWLFPAARESSGTGHLTTIRLSQALRHADAGVPAPASGSASTYQVRSVAVPFGNCIEPSNIKAGGKACPIRFQCAGCGFCRPDPSYLRAIEDHVRTLKADRETAVALGADDFVVRNLSDQADAYRQVAATMCDKLAALTDEERSEVEEASATLRKLRAAAAVPVAFTGKAAW